MVCLPLHVEGRIVCVYILFVCVYLYVLVYVYVCITATNAWWNKMNIQAE